MEPRHQVSRAGIALIKRFEGLRRVAAQLDDGRWTIGYGHTRTARPGAEVDEQAAEALLLYDLIDVSHAVNEWAYAPLNQHQFDALVSFAFSIGLSNFRGSLTLRRLTEGKPVEAALAMELWRRADFAGERIVVDSLVRRRAYEKTLFLKPVDGWAPAPTPVLPPKLDYDVASVMPSQTPMNVTGSLQGDRAQAELWESESVGKEKPEEAESARAAASVSARLEAILPDGAEGPWEETAAFPAEEPAPGIAGQATRQELGGVVAKPAEDSRRGTAPLVTQLRAAGKNGGPVPLFLLGLAGVGLFIVAVSFGFRSPVPGTPPFAGGLFGWVFGAAGIVCFALAAYFLLIRLGQGEHDPKT
jgi:lysozyme